jgi:hypothetical protein
MKTLRVFLVLTPLLLLAATRPAGAQNPGQGQGPGGVDFCKPFVETCPAGLPPLGVCVSILNICNYDAFRTGNPNLLELCCEKCFAGSELCGIDPTSTCAGFGCLP